MRSYFMPIIEEAHVKVKENPDEEPSNYTLAYLAEIERRKMKGEDLGSFRCLQSYAMKQ